MLARALAGMAAIFLFGVMEAAEMAFTGSGALLFVATRRN